VNLIGPSPLPGGEGEGGDSALLRITGIIVPIILDYAWQECMSMTRNKAREAGEIFECQPKIFYHALQVTTPKSQLLLLVKAGRVSLLVKTVKLKNLLFSNSTKWLKCGSAVVQAREDSKAAAKQVLEEHEVADQQARGSLTPISKQNRGPVLKTPRCSQLTEAV